jgi:hypothetical protein
MDSSIKIVQDLLDDTARDCLRYVATHKLTEPQYQRLAKFIFGCMNQKHELPSRVARRGSGELAKVLDFIAAAAEVLFEIDAESSEE